MIALDTAEGQEQLWKALRDAQRDGYPSLCLHCLHGIGRPGELDDHDPDCDRPYQGARAEWLSNAGRCSLAVDPPDRSDGEVTLTATMLYRDNGHPFTTEVYGRPRDVREALLKLVNAIPEPRPGKPSAALIP